VLLLVIPYWVAYSIVYVVGIAQAYWLNTRLVFRVKPTRNTAIAYPLIYVVQYLLGLLVLRGAVEILHWPQAVAIFLSIAVSMPVTFLLSRILLKSTEEVQ
jgi:putative flippase GtrA